jgi:hypothetical protein
MICKDPKVRISIKMIKNHPWFSQSEYCTLMQLSQAHTQHWETGEGQSAESAIDAEIITQMTNIGIDCHDLHQALLTKGEENDTTVIYKIFFRQKLTENMCGLMQKVAAGAAPGGRPIVHFSKNEGSGPSATVVVPGVSPRPTTPGREVVPIVSASVGQRVIGGIRATRLSTCRRLSRPIAVRRTGESFPPGGASASHETP